MGLTRRRPRPERNSDIGLIERGRRASEETIARLMCADAGRLRSAADNGLGGDIVPDPANPFPEVHLTRRAHARTVPPHGRLRRQRCWEGL